MNKNNLQPQEQLQTLEQFNADVVEARYFYEMYCLHPEMDFDE